MQKNGSHFNQVSFFNPSYFGYLFFSAQGRINRKKYIAGNIFILTLCLLMAFLVPYLFSLMEPYVSATTPHSFGELGNSRKVVSTGTAAPLITTSMTEYAYYISCAILGFISLITGIFLRIKRAHDLDKSGYWLFLLLVPVVNIVAEIYLLISAGSENPNQYGSDPLGDEILPLIIPFSPAKKSNNGDQMNGDQFNDVSIFNLSYLNYLFRFGQGRINRKKYLAGNGMMLLLCLFDIILLIIPPISIGIAFEISHTNFLFYTYYTISLILGGVYLLYSLSLFPIFLAIKRLHDFGKSGWWLLLLLLPIVSFFLTIYIVFFTGTEGPNEYGNDPR